MCRLYTAHDVRHAGRRAGRRVWCSRE